MPIHFSKLSPTSQVFTHFDETTGVQTDIASDCINQWCRATARQILLTPILADHAKVIIAARGIEPHRLSRMTLQICDKNPLLFLEHRASNTHLLADGNHRYLHYFRMGIPWAKCWILPEEDWRPFVVTGLPSTTEEDMLKSFSGIR